MVMQGSNAASHFIKEMCQEAKLPHTMLYLKLNHVFFQLIYINYLGNIKLRMVLENVLVFINGTSVPRGLGLE